MVVLCLQFCSDLGLAPFEWKRQDLREPQAALLA